MNMELESTPETLLVSSVPHRKQIMSQPNISIMNQPVTKLHKTL